MAEALSLASGIAPAKKADGRDQDAAELYKDLAAVEPIDWVVL